MSELQNGRIGVLLADADRLSAHLLATALARRRHDISIIAVCSTSAEAIRELEKNQPDVALINAHLDDGLLTGYQVLQGLRADCPNTAAIMMIPVSDPDLVVDAFRGGASGVFCRLNSSVKMLSKCIRAVYEGQIWADTQKLGFLLDFLIQSKPLRFVRAGGGMRLLTLQETKVVQLLAEGMGTREISQKLGVSEHTIRNYLSNIYEKLGVSSRVELALYALTREIAGA